MGDGLRVRGRPCSASPARVWLRTSIRAHCRDKAWTCSFPSRPRTRRASNVLYDRGAMHVRSGLPKIVRRRSAVHGLGVFAAETISKNRRIIDYAGELVRNDKECEA